MAGSRPRDTINQLMEAINRKDLESALALYEPDAIFMPEPGKHVKGKEAIRPVLAGFIALNPTLRGETDQTIEHGDLALFYSKWNLTGMGPDRKPVRMGGVSSDVLRRQADGKWLIAIDNPWGTSILA